MDMYGLYLQNELENTKTNHLLHLGLSILTFGLWVIVWGHVYIEGKKKRERLMKQVVEFAGKQESE